jgi:hypothetical protein
MSKVVENWEKIRKAYCNATKQSTVDCISKEEIGKIEKSLKNLDKASSLAGCIEAAENLSAISTSVIKKLTDAAKKEGNQKKKKSITDLNHDFGEMCGKVYNLAVECKNGLNAKGDFRKVPKGTTYYDRLLSHLKQFNPENIAYYESYDKHELDDANKAPEFMKDYVWPSGKFALNYGVSTGGWMKDRGISDDANNTKVKVQEKIQSWPKLKELLFDVAVDGLNQAIIDFPSLFLSVRRDELFR